MWWTEKKYKSKTKRNRNSYRRKAEQKKIREKIYIIILHTADKTKRKKEEIIKKLTNCERKPCTYIKGEGCVRGWLALFSKANAVDQSDLRGNAKSVYFRAPKNRVVGGMRGEGGHERAIDKTNKNYKSCERKRSVTRGERKVVKNQINIQKRRKKKL